MLCLGMHSNVMLCFMVQAFQDPPLCNSTDRTFRGSPVLLRQCSLKREFQTNPTQLSQLQRSSHTGPPGYILLDDHSFSLCRLAGGLADYNSRHWYLSTGSSHEDHVSKRCLWVSHCYVKMEQLFTAHSLTIQIFSKKRPSQKRPLDRIAKAVTLTKPKIPQNREKKFYH